MLEGVDNPGSCVLSCCRPLSDFKSVRVSPACRKSSLSRWVTELLGWPLLLSALSFMWVRARMRASASVETRVGSWCWSCRLFAGETYGRGETAQVRLCGGVVWAVGWGARITGLGWMGKVLKAIGWAGIGMGWEGWDGWDELGWVRRYCTGGGCAAVTRRMQGCVRCGGHHEVHGEALKGISAVR